MLQSVKGHLYLIMRGKEIPAKSWSTPKEDTEEITCKHSHAKITEDSDYQMVAIYKGAHCGKELVLSRRLSTMCQ